MLEIREVDKQELAEKVASKLNIKPSQVRKVVEFQFEMLSRHIHEQSDEPFILKYIGKIIRKFKPKDNPLDLRNFDF